ncbi:hypothetical protein TNCT_704871 [Trichonephila clavata]|uniref:Uncharacterized protein n=1 Tax=Trichonephila clavata TaxID=2740835 RepID=A0A8X6HXL8_TRICU|nr:hypothetical protein TNCT_704871 [Trichonephila clavata]
MNRDDSDLSSLSDEDDYQSDNGSEMDDDDEDQDVTFDFSAPTQWGIHTDKFNPVSFDFQEVGGFKYQSTLWRASAPTSFVLTGTNLRAERSELI